MRDNRQEMNVDTFDEDVEGFESIDLDGEEANND